MTIRYTSELPEEVGTVFVTNVPGAPFQVLGRRGPTRELFVGSLVTERQSAPTLVEALREMERKHGVTAEIVPLTTLKARLSSSHLCYALANHLSTPMLWQERKMT
jgi:hypothetical protein